MCEIEQEFNTVFPDFTTGGEAFSEILLTNRTLRDLDLSWNRISKDSALTLAQSLASNNSLTSLNLAYNNIGNNAAQHLAHSLRQNNALTKLDVSYNMILPTAILVTHTRCYSNDIQFFHNFILEYFIFLVFFILIVLL